MHIHETDMQKTMNYQPLAKAQQSVPILICGNQLSSGNLMLSSECQKDKQMLEGPKYADDLGE